MAMSNMDTNKTLKHQNLVNNRKLCRKCTNSLNHAEDLCNPSDIDRGKYDCNQIGAWSLWQGNLDTSILLVGQDWGSKAWFKRVQGLPSSKSPTDKNLVTLFNSLGFDLKLAKDTTVPGQFFFTNAVLCMKQGDSQSAIKQEWFHNCATNFLKPLIELIRPKVVICLGRKAYYSVMYAYNMEKKDFHAAVSSWEPDLISSGIKVFAVYHCGAIVTNTHRKLDVQIHDWQRIRRFINK